MATLVKNDRIQILRLELGPFRTNAYILICQKTGDSVILDAPGEARKILEAIRHTNPRYILISHSHPDHVGALSQLRSALKVPIAVNAEDVLRLPAPADRYLRDGDRVSFGAVELDVLHTPGHTPGSICFHTDPYLLSGDTLFPGGPGRTESPENFRQIVDAITKKLFALPDDTKVYPGHGAPTTLKEEKAAYRVFSERPHATDLCGDIVWETA